MADDFGSTGNLYKDNVFSGDRQIVGNVYGNVNFGAVEGQRTLPKALLDVSPPEVDRDSVLSKRGRLVPEACQWIDNDFKKFCTVEACCMWIHGLPGKGKTMKAVYLTRKMEELRRSSADVTFIGYFFCTFDDPRRNTVVAFLKSLVKQLLQNDHADNQVAQKLKKVFNEALQSQGDALFERRESLSRLLHRLLRELPGRKFILLDALDECEPKQTYIAVANLLEDHFHDEVKWIFTSRDSHNIISTSPRVRSATHIINLAHFREDITEGVRAYIENRLIDVAQDNLDIGAMRLPDQKLESSFMHLKNDLTLGASGNFLWASIKIEQLRDDPDSFELDDIGMPSDILAETYSRILQKILTFPNPKAGKGAKEIDQRRRTAIQRLLLVMSSACRSLTVDELATIIGVPTIIPQEEVRRNKPGAFDMSSVLRWCRLLLEIIDGTVHFVHLSLKEYILEQTTSETSIFRNDDPTMDFDAHRLILEASLTCLENVDEDLGKLSRQSTPKVRQNSLAHYATEYWVVHARKLESMELADLENLTRFIAISEPDQSQKLENGSGTIPEPLSHKTINLPRNLMNRINADSKTGISWKTMELDLPQIASTNDIVAIVLGLGHYFGEGWGTSEPTSKELLTLVGIAAANGYLDVLKALESYAGFQENRSQLQDLAAWASIVYGEETVLQYVQRRNMTFSPEMVMIAAYRGFETSIGFLLARSKSYKGRAQAITSKNSFKLGLVVDKRRGKDHESHWVPFNSKTMQRLDKFPSLTIDGGLDGITQRRVDPGRYSHSMYTLIQRLTMKARSSLWPEELGEQMAIFEVCNSVLDTNSAWVIEDSDSPDFIFLDKIYLEHGDLFVPEGSLSSYHRDLESEFLERNFKQPFLYWDPSEKNLSTSKSSDPSVFTPGSLSDFGSPFRDRSSLLEARPVSQYSKLLVIEAVTKSLLEIAVERSYPKTAHALLESGVSVDSVDALIALHRAFVMGNEHMMLVLLKGGVRPDALSDLIISDSSKFRDGTIMGEYHAQQVEAMKHSFRQNDDPFRKNDYSFRQNDIGNMGLLYGSALKGDIWKVGVLLEFSSIDRLKKYYNRALQHSYAGKEEVLWSRDIQVVRSFDKISDLLLPLPSGWTAHKTAVDSTDYFTYSDDSIERSQFQHPNVPVASDEDSMDSFWALKGRLAPKINHISEIESTIEFFSDSNSDFDFDSDN